ETPEPAPTTDEVVVIAPQEDESFWIEKVEDGWRVHGRKIERIAAMTYFEFDSTLLRFQNILESMGITKALEKAGVQPEDTVYIGEAALEWGAE
ncbi:MAG TPA: DUF1967 domain-containing protein, partial [Anaerolineae bacterium]|nr:DUF1967 domain-containing protein [Anaerolineae bacterium]